MSGVLRGVLVALLVVVVLGAGALGWIYWRINREIVTPLETLNAEGTAGHALAVLSPGISPFPERIMSAFNEGLTEKGWRVDRTTASGAATADFASYDLIVLASPIYSSKVAPPLLAYVARAGDFGGRHVAVLVTAAGDPSDSIENTRNLLSQAGATLAAIHGYAVYAPNDRDNRYEGSNTDRAVAMAHDAALALADGPK